MLENSPPLASGWTGLGFDDTSWRVGPSGFSALAIGYYREATLLTPSEYEIPPFSCVRFRHEFRLEPGQRPQWLTLRIDYDDGFVAYINGVEIARRGMEGPAGGQVPPAALATRSHAAGTAEEIDLTSAIGLLREGQNVLAIQLHNAAQEWADLILVPELCANFTRGPFIQNVSARTAQVVWKTFHLTEGWVEYGPTPGLGQIARSAATNTVHAVTLANLDPQKRYFYRVMGSSVANRSLVAATTPVESFQTLAEQGSLRFAVIGDSGQGSVGQYRIANVLDQLNPDLVLHSGDVIYPSFTDGRADQRLFSVYQNAMKRIPFYFTIGNHDIYSGVGYYLDALFLPTNSVPLLIHSTNTTPEHYYSFDHGDAHFAVVYQPILSQYKMRVGDPQYQWLTNDLATTRKPWKFMLFHMPVRTSSSHRTDNYNLNGAYDRTEVEEVIWPIAARYGVQLVINGHDHAYERFVPVDGVHAVVSGGGGGIPYGLNERDVLSSQFRSVYHCLDVSIQGDTLRLRAVDDEGIEFDSMVIQRANPSAQSLVSTWAHPRFEPTAVNDGDGNVSDQAFDFHTPGRPAVSGGFSNLGECHVQNDKTNLYVGFSKVMLAPGQNLFVFLAGPSGRGVAGLKGLGNGIVDPTGQGSDGLDFLENLAFQGWSPSLGVIAGDEFADGTLRDFGRRLDPLPSGQGIFRLDRDLSSLASGRLQQFNQWPAQSLDQAGRLSASFEENADFIQISIPLSELGALPGAKVWIGAVVGLPVVNTNATVQARALDSGFLGSAFSDVAGTQVLSPIEYVLTDSGDADGDGLADADEGPRGTDALRPDTDHDGLPDGWEVLHAMDATSNLGLDGALGDLDADGFDNRSEWIAGTDPRSNASRLRLIGKNVGAGLMRLSWSVVRGRTYRLERSNSAAGNFLEVRELGFPRRSEMDGEDFVELGPNRVLGKEIVEGGHFFRIRVTSD